MKKKGSIEMWMWIIGGILVGLLILGLATMYISNLIKDKTVRDMISQFDFLKTRIDMVCYQYPGSKAEDVIIYLDPSFQKLYLTDYEEYEKYIHNKSYKMKVKDIGNVICLEYGTSYILKRCYKLKCDVKLDALNKEENIFLRKLLEDKDVKVIYKASIEKQKEYVKVKFKLTK